MVFPQEGIINSCNILEYWICILMLAWQKENKLRVFVLLFNNTGIGCFHLEIVWSIVFIFKVYNEHGYYSRKKNTKQWTYTKGIFSFWSNYLYSDRCTVNILTNLTKQIIMLNESLSYHPGTLTAKIYILQVH